MKKLAFILAVVLFINTMALSYVLYRNNQYKTDYSNLFGKDKYFVENLENGNIKVYIMAPKNSDEEYSIFDILEDFMNEKGYKNLPDERLGATHFFINSEGNKVDCVATNYRNYTEWYIMFGKD